MTRETESAWLSRLPLERQTQLRRWPDRQARHRSLLAGRLLSTGLRRLGYPAQAVSTLRHPPSSRPTIDLPVDFSLSHCDGLVLCALSAQGAVGIDAEAIGALTADAFPHYLDSAERAWAGASPRRFYAVWTRKEAVAKASGTNGLPALPAIDTRPGEAITSFGGRLWGLREVDLGPGHVAHVVHAALADPLARVDVARLSRHALEFEPEFESDLSDGKVACAPAPLCRKGRISSRPIDLETR